MIFEDFHLKNYCRESYDVMQENITGVHFLVCTRPIHSAIVPFGSLASPKKQYHSHLTWWSISRAYITRPAHGIRLYNLTRSVFFERCLKASLRHVHGLNHTHTESNVKHSHTWKQVTSCIVNQTFIHTNASHDWRSYNQQQQCCECRHDIWKIKLNHHFFVNTWCNLLK